MQQGFSISLLTLSQTSDYGRTDTIDVLPDLQEEVETQDMR